MNAVVSTDIKPLPRPYFRAAPQMAALVVIVGLGLGLGGAIGYLSAAREVPSETTVSEWQFEVPQISAQYAAGYRQFLAEARAAVEAAMRDQPTSPAAVSALAIFHYLSHDSEGERRCWQRCLELDPRNTLAYSRLVALSQQKANYEDIVQLMEGALRVDPDNATYRGLLGSALMYLNRPAQARQQLELILVSGRGDVETYLLLGEACNQLDRPALAKRYLSVAVDLAPARPDVLYALIKAHNKLGERQQADELVARLEELKSMQLAGEATRETLRDEKFMPPRIAEILTFVGKSYLERGSLDAAQRHFEQATTVAPADVESRKQLVQLATQRNDWQAALRRNQELRELEPGNRMHVWNEGAFLERAGRVEEAEQVFRDICDSQPADDAGYSALAALLLRNNRKLNEARSLAERAVQLSPSAHNYWLLGLIAKRQGDVSAARAALKQAISIDPENKEMSALYESLGQP
jgi:tetratricopeptide (TPR) repeat protein